MDVNDDLDLKELSSLMADKYGQWGYRELCEKWKIPHNAEQEKIYIAGFTTGAYSAFSSLLESRKLRK